MEADADARIVFSAAMAGSGLAPLVCLVLGLARSGFQDHQVASACLISLYLTRSTESYAESYIYCPDCVRGCA
jgi:hypothetical protein